jgi:hypothetical protein
MSFPRPGIARQRIADEIGPLIDRIAQLWHRDQKFAEKASWRFAQDNFIKAQLERCLSCLDGSHDQLDDSEIIKLSNQWNQRKSRKYQPANTLDHIPTVVGDNRGWVQYASSNTIVKIIPLFRSGLLNPQLAIEWISHVVLRHPGIAAATEIRHDDAALYLTTPSYGLNLHAWIRTNEKYAAGMVDTIWSLVRQLLEAIDYLHRHGITHGDINPNNICINYDKLTLIDLGSVAFYSRLGNSATPGYFRERDQSAANDMYGFGTTLYMVLTSMYHPYVSAKLSTEAQSKIKLLYRMTEQTMYDLPAERLMAVTLLNIHYGRPVTQAVDHHLLDRMTAKLRAESNSLTSMSRPIWMHIVNVMQPRYCLEQDDQSGILDMPASAILEELEKFISELAVIAQ